MTSHWPTRRDAIAGLAGLVVGGTGTVGTSAARGADGGLSTLAKHLARNGTGRVVLPGDADYAGIKNYNGRFDCVRTKAFVRPTTTAGVAEFVRWASERKRTFAVRGGGHSFEGRSSHPDLVLDMSLMRAMSLDGGTLNVEAGVQLGRIYQKLSPLERVLPAGTCPSVGVVGHVLGGGIGDYLPMFGYAAQSLTEVEIVTFQGHVLTINDAGISGEEAPTDIEPRRLMRLLRGAGQGTIGVVTRMKLATQDVRDAKMASFKLDGGAITLARMVAILEAWQRWRSGLTVEMQSVVSSKLNLGRSASTYSCEIAGLIVIPPRSSISIDAVRRTLDPLFAMAELRERNFVPRLNAAGAVKTFLDTDETTHNPSRKRMYGASSALPTALPMNAVEHVLRNMAPNIFLSLYTAGGVSKTVAETCLHPAEFIVEWTIYSRRSGPEHRRRIADLRTSTIRRAGWSEDLGYPNYPDSEDRNYFTDAAWIRQTAKRFDPASSSTSSLLVRAEEAGCT